jgi:alcohol dehydrogenase
MKAWILEKPGGVLSLQDVPTPTVRPGCVLVEMKAVPLLSYTRAYLNGDLPYWYPGKPFTPGANGVGVIKEVGEGFYHLKPGQRVAVTPYLVANEPVVDPAQILMGLSGISPDSGQMLADWPDGTLREMALFPASTVTVIDGLEAASSTKLAASAKFVVALGGLLRGRFAAGETLIVHGATGYFGSGAVMLGVAMGAERVIAAGRNQDTLLALADQVGPQVVPVVLSGKVEDDAAKLKKAAGGAVQLGFDMVGQADSPNGTLPVLNSLSRGGRLVLGGSMTVPLPISYGNLLRNNWEIIGNFMYPPEAYRTLMSLIRAGKVDLEKINIINFGLADLDQAIDAASTKRGLDCTVVTMN